MTFAPGLLVLSEKKALQFFFLAVSRDKNNQELVTSMGAAHTLRNHPVGGFEVVHMAFQQNRDHRNVVGREAEVVAERRKGHHMHAEAGGNLRDVGVEEYDARSLPDRSILAASAAESALGNVVEGYNHGEDHVYHIRPQEGILGEGASGIGKDCDTGVVPQQVERRQHM